MRVKYASERNADEARRAHIERVVQEYAGPAFWQEVGKAFPHVKSGDFGPDETMRIESAMEQAITTWLMWNEPQPTHDQLVALGELCKGAAMGMEGQLRSLAARMGPDHPSPGQARCEVTDRDLVVTVAIIAEDDAITRGDERTGVTIIAPLGDIKASYEVQ